MVKEPLRSLLWFWGGVLLICLATTLYSYAQGRSTLAYWESLRVSPPCVITNVSNDQITIATAEGPRVWVKVLNLSVETLVLDRLAKTITPVSPKTLKQKQVVIVIYREQEAVEVHVWK